MKIENKEMLLYSMNTAYEELKCAMIEYNMNEKEVMLISDKGKKSIVSLEFFLTIWKGTVLIIDPLQTVQQESYY